MPDDGSARPGPGARLAWQAPGGDEGLGPAVVVTADGGGGGVLRAWTRVPAFDPRREPRESADHTAPVDRLALEQLFLRLGAAETSGLPHEAPWTGCYPVFHAQQCATCPAIELGYHVADQVLPELACVSGWLEDRLPTTMRNPAEGCDI